MTSSHQDAANLSNRLTTWLSVISTVITLGLSVGAFFLNYQIQQLDAKNKEITSNLESAKLAIQKLEVERKLKQTDFELVAKSLPDLLKEDPANRSLKINFITLILGTEEANKLFAGLATSQNKTLASICEEGTNIVQKQKKIQVTAYDQAVSLERQGFDALIQGDFEQAIAAFKSAEETYPQFHSVYEIANLLQQNKDELKDANKRKSILREIAENYSWQAPPEAIKRLKELSK